MFFELSLLFLLSFLVAGLGNLTRLPSFVLALIVGLLARDVLSTITANSTLLSAIVALGATLILFGGGLEVPYKNFLKLSPKILSLSLVGLGLTAFLFSQSLTVLAPLSPVSLSIPVLVLLGAILASTDPAAIIPVLRGLRFRRRDTKDIIISESAVTDVTGTLLTVVFLTILTAGTLMTNISDAYGNLFTQDAGILLLKEIVFGVLVGAIGFAMLEFLHAMRKRSQVEDASDVAYFIAVPVLAFFVAALAGGSGYLAAFVAGLLMHMTEHLGETEHFFNKLIDAFLKPIIFILLGALVNLQELWQYAGIGLAAAFVFMFFIRPLTVFISLLPWFFLKKEKITWREALFISFVRETGAIPAVLLVTVVSSGLPDLQGLVPIGMWVILTTLVIEPPLTPFVAKLLDIGESMSTTDPALHPVHPSVLFASRGNSHLKRLGKVVDWASKHGMERIYVLLCPEDDYSEEYAETLRSTTWHHMEKLNEKQLEKGLHEIDFHLEVHEGLLQDNIDQLCHEEASITVLFVGKGVLDYRLAEMKKLKVPFYFLD